MSAKEKVTTIQYLSDGPEDSPVVFLFAHGAGGPMRSSFMATVARLMGAQGIRVVRFEFPYMREKRRAPDRQPVLLDTWREAIADQGGGSRVAVGGKSMGGRMASMIADEMNVRGLVCFGYPFHPPGKLDQLRTAHLETLRTPTLILQGTRDSFGTQEQVAEYALSPAIRVEWVPDGDHSFKPRASSGTTEKENVARAAAVAAAFLKDRFPSKRHS